MPKFKLDSKSSRSFRDRIRPFLLALVVSLLLVYSIWTFTETVWPSFSISTIFTNSTTNHFCIPRADYFNRTHDPPETTFYDDPQLSYSLDKPLDNWDDKRSSWLKLHPSFADTVENRIFLITGSLPLPCKSPIGDHLLLRCFKNKADYCRIHGYDIFYGNSCFDPKLCNVWAKVALIRASMVAHPEAEWIWWMDAEAVITDMDFKIPLERYKQHNLVIPGWPNLIYEKKSWVAVNTGSFLIRNCQWSLDFLDVWTNMSPRSPDYKFWSETLKSTLSDKAFPGADDQSSLVYLLLREKKKWGDMIYLENEYYSRGYWVEIVGRFNEIIKKYFDIEQKVPALRRRRAEVVSESLRGVWEKYMGDLGFGFGNGGWRRPFITHFTGCQPCTGNHDPSYKGNSCWIAMEKVLNFADNQVLRRYGFAHPDLGNGSTVFPLPFDFPADENNELV
ncbi:hypothetical protein ACH5RR_011556 [Cinchona calisaya]|uniref:Uncharacterized protein n=1 Tax=Cinchona calisaya TaxID=153742 RepID=A0ABD3A8P5_9GENT